ncbi:MAG: CPBP family intramembrane metalloprotease [Ruminococcaceae bacterium]|nr:CPBP family intramembrane metalloprotease [Oscillospiraceae bacterium]
MTPNRFDVDKYYYPKAPLLPALLYALCYFLFYYLVRTLIYRCAYIYFLSANAGNIEAAAEMYYESANMIAFLSGIIILAFLAVFFSFRKKKLSQAFYLNKTRASTALICFFTGIFLNFMTTLIISYLPESLLESYSDASSGAMQGHTVWYIFAAVIMAPILEEVIFRAMMLSRISTATGNVIAIILSSVIFGVVHGHIVWSTYAFVLGAFLGTVFVRTRSVKASIITHFGFNLVSLLSYIDIESMPQTYQMLYQTLLSLCYSLSVPISIAFIIILFHETADTSSRMPVGFNEE